MNKTKYYIESYNALSWTRPLKGHLVQCLHNKQGYLQPDRVVQSQSNPTLTVSRDGASASSLLYTVFLALHY